MTNKMSWTGQASQRLHPSSLFFDAIHRGKQWFLPIALGMFGASRGQWYGTAMWPVIAMGIAATVGAFLISVVRFFTLRYRVVDNDLVVDEGWLFHNRRTVPIARIQNVDLVQNLFHRLLHVAECRIETASGTKPEATFRVLGLAQIELLRNHILSLQQADAVAPVAGPTLRAEPALQESNLGPLAEPVRLKENNAPSLLLAITSWRLVQAGWISNRGLLIVPLLAGFLFQFGPDNYFGNWLNIDSYINMGEKRINGEKIREQFRMPTKHLGEAEVFKLWPGIDSGSLPSSRTAWIAIGVAGLFVALMVVKLLSIAWYVWRFYGYRLTRDGEDLRIQCGLSTKVTATIPRNRIQLISIHRTWLGRILGLASIRIETAGGAGKANEDAAASVARRWFIPVLRNAEVVSILRELRPGLNWDEATIEWRPVSLLARRRVWRMSLVVSLIVAVVAGLLWRPWGALILVLLVPGSYWWAAKKAKAMRYARGDFGIAYRSGLLTRKCSLTFLDKVQTIGLSQSPFDRRWRMATLKVDTAAAGPAEHVISIEMLDETFAEAEFAALAENASQVGLC